MIIPLVAHRRLPGRAGLRRPSSWSSSSTCPRKRHDAKAASGRRSSAPFTWSVISLAVSAPIGVLAAVYLNEYARDNWFNRIINLAVINLAGVPSIVHALFGLGAFVYAARFGYSIISASLTLAIMTLPVIIASTREALARVPCSFREACWNVGATRWQTIRAVVLPNSISGILTGVILQVSRAAGETAPIMFTGAVFFKAVQRGDLFPYGLHDQCMALSMHLYTLSTQVPDVKESDSLRHRGRAARLGAAGQRHRHRRCASTCAPGRNGEARMSDRPNTIEVEDLRLALRGRKEVLHGISFDIHRNEIFGIIGPAQSGKTSLLRCLNRTIDFTPDARVSGIDPGRRRGRRGRSRTSSPCAARSAWSRRCRSACRSRIYDNVAFAPRCAGMTRKERARRDRRALPAPGRAVGRGEGPPRQPRHQALRRPAAAPHHRPRPLAPARDSLPRRVLHRHRPGDHDAHRGRAQGAAPAT